MNFKRLNPILEHSPWGKPDSQRDVADGIVLLSTPSHGGYWLSQERYDSLPKALQCNVYGGSTFFEEDIEAAIIDFYYDIEIINPDFSMFKGGPYQGVYDYLSTTTARGEITLAWDHHTRTIMKNRIQGISPIVITSVFVSNGGVLHSYVDNHCSIQDTDQNIVQRAYEALLDQIDPVVQELRYLVSLQGSAEALSLSRDDDFMNF